MLGKIRRLWNKFWYGSEVKKVKVTCRDIQRNIVQIQEAMNWVHSDIKAITTKMAELKAENKVDSDEYKKLEAELKSKNELYSTFQKEQEQEYTTLKKMKDSKFMMQPKEALIVGGLVFLGTFAIALERENPKALKLVTFILKLMPLHV